MTPNSERIVGPDGSTMLHVQCEAEQSQCFKMAGESCPYGYDIRPVFESDHEHFLVRCRPPVTVMATPNNSPSYMQVAPSVPQQQRDAWPPRAEPWTPAAPWPPPNTAAAATPPPAPAASGQPAAPGTNKPELEVGY